MCVGIKMLLVEVGVGTVRAILKSPRMVRTLLNHHLTRDICTQCLRDLQRNIVSHEGPAHAEVPLPRAPGGPGPCGMPCGAMHDGSHIHHLGVDPRLVYGMSQSQAVV